ncbi:glycine cleavage system aminomethyltransferase GcvT [Tichowtungia aerotolerans]|uniref:glycine cleavage system aminomethyltransferase GcvT n=1 Tax=Tichowtungia aerotolerans TaxID=2697043 RepID=UPI001E564FFE|nr:glycine cleavage system aminomethyltransferase GcvT [Tichowtungia aerotolerans]
MKHTPLHEEHITLGARMAEFGGWDMPIQYEGILAEHQHTRTQTGLFDICHMGEFELTGPTAAADLENLLTMKVSTLAVGQCRYGFMLNEEGGVIDDLTCYCLDDARYMLVVNAATRDGDAEWIQNHLSPETVFTDRSNELAKLDVQGPQARTDLEKVFGSIPDIGYFRAEFFRGLEKLLGAGSACLDTEMLISRTGYTGELGYELYFPASEAVRIWRALLGNENIKPIGLGARDTLRLEMGYSLYGHELSTDRTPAGVSRGMFIKKDQDFIGRDAVMRDLETPAELLVALEFESKRAARAHDKVFLRGLEMGEVTSGSVSPSLGKAVALALVKADAAGLGTVLDVEIRGKQFPATVVNLPFYPNGTARG